MIVTGLTPKCVSSHPAALPWENSCPYTRGGTGGSRRGPCSLSPTTFYPDSLGLINSSFKGLRPKWGGHWTGSQRVCNLTAVLPPMGCANLGKSCQHPGLASPLDLNTFSSTAQSCMKVPRPNAHMIKSIPPPTSSEA